MSSKREKAEFLLEELSGISDVYVAQAAAAGKKRRSLPLLRIVPVIAACLLLFFGLTGLGVGRGMKKNEAQEEQGLHSDSSCSRVMKAQDATTPGSTLRVILQEAGESDYRVMEVGDKAGVLVSLLGQGRALTAEEAEKIGRRVWLLFPGGEVVSPDLCASPGNLSYGRLFSYVPEIAPAGEWDRLLAALTEGGEAG